MQAPIQCLPTTSPPPTAGREAADDDRTIWPKVHLTIWTT